MDWLCIGVAEQWISNHNLWHKIDTKHQNTRPICKFQPLKCVLIRML